MPPFTRPLAYALLPLLISVPVRTFASPGESAQLHEQARALAVQGQVKSAIDLESKAAALAPGSVAPQRGLSFLYSELGDWEKAAAAARKAVQIAPRDYVSRLNLASILQSQKQFGQSYTEYAQALELAPESPDAQIGMSQCLVSLGRYDEAILQLDLALAMHPHNQQIWLNRAATLLRAGELAEAAVAAHKAELIGPRSYGLIYLLADIELARLNYNPARTLAAELVDMDRTNPRSYLLLAKCYYYNTQRQADAGDVLTRALSAIPDNVGLYAALGVAFRKKGDEMRRMSLAARLDEAPPWWRLSERALDHAVKLSRESPDLRLELARTLVRERKFHEALDQISAARKIAPANLRLASAERELSWVKGDLIGEIKLAIEAGRNKTGPATK